MGLALDSEGVAPAKRYYEEFGVTFPALVDPNYATKFGAVPKTFFIDEHGVVMDAKKDGGWESQLSKLPDPKSATDEIKSKWSRPADRLTKSSIAELVASNEAKPKELETAAELGSRLSLIHI